MIYIDASRYNNTPRRTGIENYSYYLISALAALAPKEITLVSPRPIPLPVAQRIIPFPRLWTQARLSFEIWRNKAIRTLFIPSHFMPLVHAPRTIITIHDVAFRRFPESYSWKSRWYLHWGTKRAVKKAAAIITPSLATKQDLIELYGASAEKITVIPHGYEPLKIDISPKAVRCTPDRLREKYGLIENHYFLFLGRIESKKNLAMLIETFNEFSRSHPEAKLALAGKSGVGDESIRRAASQNPNIVMTGYVDEAIKINLLQNARAFVFPSLYEGFGFPLLEAMQFDLPIIASDIPASREVAQDAALFFEIQDKQTLLNHLKTVWEKPETYEPLMKKYSDILKNHTWEICAQKTWEALNTH